MALLAELIARDGQTCVWCGRELWTADLTAEHLLPRSRGGRGTPENLAVACRGCNRTRGTRTVSAHLRATRATPTPALLAALTRLAGSPRRDHAAYGTRQLALLAGVAADHSSPA